jgi:Tfp pilus assembly protein PilO
MSLPFDREMVAHIVIGLALCAGGWFLFVQPKLGELHKLQASVMAHTGESFVNEASADRFAHRIEGLRTQVLNIEQRNELSRDSSKLYRQIMVLARDHGVEVQALRPTYDRNAHRDDSIYTVPFSVSVVGGYRQVAQFIDAIDGMDGFVRSTSFTIDPTGERGQSLVAAQYGFEAMAFDLPDSLLRLTGVSDAVQ